MQHGPNNYIRKRIGKQLRAVWNASLLQAAEAELMRDKQGENPASIRMRTRGWGFVWRARRLHIARRPSQRHAHLKRHQETDPAGTQAAHIKGLGLSKRRLPRAPFNRSPRRNRRKMGSRNQGIYKMRTARRMKPSPQFPDITLCNQAKTALNPSYALWRSAE